MNNILPISSQFPIKTNTPIHKGKVRSVYWLDNKTSQRLIKENGYDIPLKTPLAIMIISDRISAFDCIWRGESGLDGIPLKGASLNCLSAYWFKLFKKNKLIKSHIVDIPHPYVWIVQKSNVIKVEFILRLYITGSMWRKYEKGHRTFCGHQLPDGLKKNQKLPKPLITPSTKGIIRGIKDVPEYDDVDINKEIIFKHPKIFNLKSTQHFKVIEKNILKAVNFIEKKLQSIGQIFVDTKFELGYSESTDEIIFIDEVATPDSSRFWNKQSYDNGNIVENSKEVLRSFLLKNLDNDILLKKEKMFERTKLAESFRVPAKTFYEISQVYTKLTELVTKEKIAKVDNIEEEILACLNSYKLI